MTVSVPLQADPRDFVNESLKDANDSFEMAVNGSITPVEFYYNIPTNKRLVLTSYLVVLASAKIDPNDFGNLPALTNGLILDIKDTASGKILLNVFGRRKPVRKTLDFADLVGSGYQVDRGAKTEVLIAELSLSQANIVTSIQGGSTISMTVRDDLSTLSTMEARIKGFLDTATGAF